MAGAVRAAGAAKGSRRTRRRVSHRLMLLPMLILFAVVVLAAAYVSYVLWPRWPGPAVAPNAPALPIVIGEVTFNVPPAAIRVPVQRKPGVQQRVDLAFLWPSLAPLQSVEPSAQPPAPQNDLKPADRVFVTIIASSGALAPAARFKMIYPRYTAKEPERTSGGLVSLSFREGTPYQGEDLIYEAANPERFFTRCTRGGAGRVPGTCLVERRMRSADMIVRFPRRWLSNWQAVATGIDRLISSLEPH